MNRIISILSLFTLLIFTACRPTNNNPGEIEQEPSVETSPSTISDTEATQPLSDLEKEMAIYVGDYFCCPNENARDEILVACDNLKPSSYNLSINSDKLIFSSIYWQDFIADTITHYSILGDTLLMHFSENGKMISYKINKTYSFLFDGRNNIESNGWIHNPEENGWTIDNCDMGMDDI